MMKYAFLYSLLLVSVFQTSCGQNKTPPPQDSRSKSANYSGAQLEAADTSKVPVSMVRNVKKARNGDILIASYLGVFRYNIRPVDGQETAFTNLTNKMISSRTSSFWDVLEDRKGNTWFGSKDSGVYCYNGKSLQHFTTRDGLANDRIVKMYEDKKGNIWFATGGGASRYDGSNFQNFSTNNGLSNNDLTTIMEDREGKIWFGTRGDACYYDPRLPAEKAFTVLKNKDGKTFKNVWAIIEDGKGNIWFGDGDGLWRYDSIDFIQVSQRGAYAILQDKKGNIWTTGATTGWGSTQVWALSRYDAKTLYDEKPVATEIRSGKGMDFLGILEADDGSIWYGSGAGVHRYDGKNFMDFK